MVLHRQCTKLRLFWTACLLLLACSLTINRETAPKFRHSKHMQEVVRQPSDLEVVNKQDKIPSCNETTFHQVPQMLRNATCRGCQSITCHDIMFSTTDSRDTYKVLKHFMKANPRPVRPDGDFLELTKDCETFRVEQGYHLQPIDEEEAEFPIAFNILMHKDAEQAEKLLRAIYRPQNVYCIHIDAKSPKTLHEAMQGIAGCFPNVFISSRLEKVVYGGYSRLQADINCMKDLINHRNPWKYLINTAAQAFPLKTNSELVKALKIYNGANDVEGIDGNRILRGRFENEFIERDSQRIDKTGKKNPAPPDNIDIIRGSAYAIFSRAFVHFILDDSRAIRLLQWSEKTYTPDEHYWATLHHTYTNPHLRTPGGFAGKPSSKPWLATYARWGGKCGGAYRHGVCVFGIEDLGGLSELKYHFANKFYIDLEPLALECLDRWIEHKVQCPPDFDYAYYKALPFVYPP